MRKIISLLTLFMAVIIPGSGSSIQLSTFISHQAPFNLSKRTNNPQTGLSNFETFTIEPNAPTWMKLFQFMQKNETGWKKSKASYLGDVYVIQGNFKLIYTKGTNAVVINYTDNNGRPTQMVKKIEASDLDFLFDL